MRPGCTAAVGCVTESGEELVLLVERTTDDPALGEKIRARLLERTGIRPDQVHLLAPGTLPRTSSGKLRRAEALRLHLQGSLRAPRKVTFLGLVGEAARSMAARLRAGL